jgi:hypothetical protein
MPSSQYAMALRRIGVFLGLTAVLLACASSASAADAVPLRVLFVGNSLTATNDLPGRVAGLAAAAGKGLEYKEITFGGFSLEDHWNQGDARAALATGGWNVVIMQQGPSALPESQVDLRVWASRFADEARAVGTRPALLTVWPESYRRPALSDVIVSYRNAAEMAGAQLFPAGEAWHAAWDCNARLPLYGPDGFHPSALGTYAAALVVYGRLFKAPLLDASLRRGLKPKITRLLQAAAATALGRRVPATQRCGGK